MKTLTARRIESRQLLDAIAFLSDFVSCQGPLGELPTYDPAVRVLCNAIRHLRAEYKKVA